MRATGLGSRSRRCHLYGLGWLLNHTTVIPNRS